MNKDGSRHHWGSCFSLAMAGGGIRGGVVHGASDNNAAFPMEGYVEVAHLITTFFHCLGFSPDKEKSRTHQTYQLDLALVELSRKKC